MALDVSRVPLIFRLQRSDKQINEHSFVQRTSQKENDGKPFSIYMFGFLLQLHIPFFFDPCCFSHEFLEMCVDKRRTFACHLLGTQRFDPMFSDESMGEPLLFNSEQGCMFLSQRLQTNNCLVNMSYLDSTLSTK